MDQNTQDQVFEPFFSTKKEQGGGLGLAIVHGIVIQNRSFIHIESTVGVGTSVFIHFPLNEPIGVESESIVSGHGHIQKKNKKNILLVDDEEMVRYAVASQLKILGYAVSEACDIETAKNILEQQPIGLILTDIRLGK